MNIAFAKLGKSIKFKSSYSPVGGDNEAPALLRLLANNNPDKAFYIVGRSDFKRLSDEEKSLLFIHNNVIDLMGDYKSYSENFIINKLNSLNVQINYSIFMIGQLMSVNIPNKVRLKRDPTKFGKSLMMTLNYASMIVDFINNYNAPYMQIVNDPRYTISQTKDILKLPEYTLSQWQGVFEQRCFDNLEDQNIINKKFSLCYSEMEKIFLYGRKSSNKNRQRPINMMIILNEGTPSRYQLLKTWILDNITDVDVYGRWKNAEMLNDPRHKGSLQIDEIQNKLNDVKYTFIIPIANGWTTSKYIEMIHAGVIPFLHPSYDSQNNLDLPSILKPNSVEELFNTIKYLNNNVDEYEKLISNLQDKFCTQELYNGKKLSSIIIDKIIK